MPVSFLGARLFVKRQSAPLSAVNCSLVNTRLLLNQVTPFSTQTLQDTFHRRLLKPNRIKAYPQGLKTVLADNRTLSTSHLMAGNGEVRSKRKTSPIKVLDRPSKIYKQAPYLSETENGQPPQDDLYSMETDGEDRISLPPMTATADTAEWQATIEKVVRNVVSIHFCQTCSFDTDSAISSEATGFVVDAERGYILTNRHVVGAGPFWGYCIFDNHEEVGRTYAVLHPSPSILTLHL